MVGAVAVVVEALVIWQANLLVAFFQMANQTTNSSSSSSNQVTRLADMEAHRAEDRVEV